MVKKSELEALKKANDELRKELLEKEERHEKELLDSYFGKMQEERKKIFLEDYSHRDFFAMKRFKGALGEGDAPQNLAEYLMKKGWSRIKSEGRAKAYMINCKKIENDMTSISIAVEIWNEMEDWDTIRGIRQSTSITDDEVFKRGNLKSALLHRGIEREEVFKICKFFRMVFLSEGEPKRLNKDWWKMY